MYISELSENMRYIVFLCLIACGLVADISKFDNSKYEYLEFEENERAKFLILDESMNIQNVISVHKSQGNRVVVDLPDDDRHFVIVLQNPKLKTKNEPSLVDSIKSTQKEQKFSAYEGMYERNKFMGGILGFEPYKFNYLLPVNYSINREQTHNKGEEAKFQISVKKLLFSDLLAKNLDLYFAYTQQSFWNVYDGKNSRPFRESNYEPSLFMTYPIDNYPLFFDQLAFGYIHQSNGGGTLNSRSWDRIFVQGIYSYENFALSLKAWHRIKEDSTKDDNPDITNYLGYGELTLGYLFNHKHAVSLTLRNNLKSDNKGSVLIDYSYPIYKNLYLYIQYFSGYGESLIDYNRSIDRVGVGFLFSR